MGKHFEDSDRDHRLLAIAAARLRSQGLVQQEIAEWLKKSQPEVSRLLADAEKLGFLAKAPSFLGKDLDSADLDEVERLYFVPASLRQPLRDLAPKEVHFDIRVLPNGDDAFAAAAADYVAGMLIRSNLTGVMWGRTLERLTSCIRSRDDLSKAAKSSATRCIPLCGDPVHLMNQGKVRYSASNLAAELGKTLNPSGVSSQPCLVGVPAYLPRRLVLQRGSTAAAWQGFVQEIPGYREIFGPCTGDHKPLVERVDTIISGAGIIFPGPERPARGPESLRTAAHDETGDFIRERLALEDGLDAKTLAGLIYGDVGGWLLERQNLRPGGRRIVEELNQGWTGVKANHLQAVALEAHPDHRPGVIVLAAGAAKVDMALEIVRRGFVNTLLVDSKLAEALQARLA